MTSERIKTMYEDLGMTVEEIAGEENVDTSLVKTSLAASSHTYTEKLKAGKEEDITDEEYKTYLTAYKELAIAGSEEYPAIKERSLRWLMEEKKGRNEARIKALAQSHGLGTNFNVLVLQNALDASAKIKKKLQGKKKAELIEV